MRWRPAAAPAPKTIVPPDFPFANGNPSLEANAGIGRKWLVPLPIKEYRKLHNSLEKTNEGNRKRLT